MEKNRQSVNAASQQQCDVKIWRESCERSEYSNEGDKYLCTTCGTTVSSDREVHHEHFPHLSGDEDNMS